MIAKMYVGDIGAEIEVTVLVNNVVQDISTATSMYIFAKPPTGNTKQFTASFVTDGTDGKIVYTTTSANDFDSAGVWQIQAKIIAPSSNFRTEIKKITVTANI